MSFPVPISPITIAIVAFAFSVAKASDQGPLQDLCVATNDPNATVFVNGRICKDPNLVSADDFFTSGLNVSGVRGGDSGITLNPVNVDRVAGLNTLGLFLIRVDYESGALVAPHTHPWSSELIFVLEGTLDVGFVTTTDPSNRAKSRLYAKTLYAGDVFVIPQGFLHFQANVGTVNATSINALNSQSPGFVDVASELFGSGSAISEDVLSKAFRVDKEVIELIRSQFA